MRPANTLFSNKPCPCYGCEDRKQGCHGSCERYKKWSAELSEQKQLKIKKDCEHYNDVLNSYMKDAKTKRIRRDHTR